MSAWVPRHTALPTYRMLTDRQHPFSTARYTHWFESYDSEGWAGIEI